MDKENVVYMHYRILLSCKENQIMNIEGNWVELEKIILSDIIQTQKDNCLIFSLISDDRSNSAQVST